MTTRAEYEASVAKMFATPYEVLNPTPKKRKPLTPEQEIAGLKARIAAIELNRKGIAEYLMEEVGCTFGDCRLMRPGGKYRPRGLNARFHKYDL